MKKRYLGIVLIVLFGLLCVPFAYLALKPSGNDALFMASSISCDLNACRTWGVVDACGKEYMAGNVDVSLWHNCVQTCIDSDCLPDNGLLFFSVPSTAAKYDLDHDCYLDRADELDAMTADWVAGRINSLEWSYLYQDITNHEKIPSCSTTPTTQPQTYCAASCEAFSGECDKVRTCTDIYCNSFTENRAVPCICFLNCGDGNCVKGVYLCDEDCNTCPLDCGSCATTTHAPTTQPYTTTTQGVLPPVPPADNTWLFVLVGVAAALVAFGAVLLITRR
jgi:hypothetical protein